MSIVTALVARYRAFTDNPDPLAKLAATVAFIVASNQPFYPLYLYAIVGDASWPAWLTLLTTPFFGAVPVVARRHSLAGRALLVVTGVANTVLCVKWLGAATGVELFLLPCVLLAAVLFRESERAVMLPMMALPFVCYLWINGWLGAPLAVFSASDMASVIRLHAISVASLIAVIGWLVSGLFQQR